LRSVNQFKFHRGHQAYNQLLENTYELNRIQPTMN
jgi:hypothetical protein